MAHKANVTLNCDIEYQGKIIFENRQVWFYADVELSNIEWDGHHIDYYECSEWSSDDAIEYGNRDGYLYTVVMTEWCSDSEVEDFDEDVLFSEFKLLVKSEDYDDLEVDYGYFEPCPDDMYERVRDMLD